MVAQVFKKKDYFIFKRNSMVAQVLKFFKNGGAGFLKKRLLYF